MMECPPVLALSDPKRREHADAHWRIARPLARLAERGVDARACWLDGNGQPSVSPSGRIVLLQRTSFIESNPATGTIVAHGDRVAEWVEAFRQQGARAVIADMDDDTVSPAYLDWLDASGGLDLVKRSRLETEQSAWQHVIANVDAVTVSTEPLAEVVRQYTTAPVHVVPNAIDVAWFQSRLGPRPPWADTLTVGWAGGRRPDADLAPMATAWARIARRHPDVRFVVAGWQPDVIYRELDAVGAIDRIVRVPWAELDRYPEVMRVDIGCCPLDDTPFNRCKSPIKAWEYGLAGAAVVASPTVYGPCLRTDDTGYIAGPADEWEDALADQIGWPDWRTENAAEMRAHVERHHALTDNLDTWVRAYRQIAGEAG